MLQSISISFPSQRDFFLQSVCVYQKKPRLLLRQVRGNYLVAELVVATSVWNVMLASFREWSQKIALCNDHQVFALMAACSTDSILEYSFLLRFMPGIFLVDPQLMSVKYLLRRIGSNHAKRGKTA